MQTESTTSTAFKVSTKTDKKFLLLLHDAVLHNPDEEEDFPPSFAIDDLTKVITKDLSPPALSSLRHQLDTFIEASDLGSLDPVAKKSAAERLLRALIKVLAPADAVPGLVHVVFSESEDSSFTDFISKLFFGCGMVDADLFPTFEKTLLELRAMCVSDGGGAKKVCGICGMQSDNGTECMNPTCDSKKSVCMAGRKDPVVPTGSVPGILRPKQSRLVFKLLLNDEKTPLPADLNLHGFNTAHIRVHDVQDLCSMLETVVSRFDFPKDPEEIQQIAQQWITFIVERLLADGMARIELAILPNTPAETVPNVCRRLYLQLEEDPESFRAFCAGFTTLLEKAGWLKESTLCTHNVTAADGTTRACDAPIENCVDVVCAEHLGDWNYENQTLSADDFPPPPKRSRVGASAGAGGSE